MWTGWTFHHCSYHNHIYKAQRPVTSQLDRYILEAEIGHFKVLTTMTADIFPCMFQIEFYFTALQDCNILPTVWCLCLPVALSLSHSSSLSVDLYKTLKCFIVLFFSSSFFFYNWDQCQGQSQRANSTSPNKQDNPTQTVGQPDRLTAPA